MVVNVHYNPSPEEAEARYHLKFKACLDYTMTFNQAGLQKRVYLKKINKIQRLLRCDLTTSNAKACLGYKVKPGLKKLKPNK